MLGITDWRKISMINYLAHCLRISMSLRVWTSVFTPSCVGTVEACHLFLPGRILSELLLALEDDICYQCDEILAFLYYASITKMVRLDLISLNESSNFFESTLPPSKMTFWANWTTLITLATVRSPPHPRISFEMYHCSVLWFSSLEGLKFLQSRLIDGDFHKSRRNIHQLWGRGHQLQCRDKLFFHSYVILT